MCTNSTFKSGRGSNLHWRRPCTEAESRDLSCIFQERSSEALPEAAFTKLVCAALQDIYQRLTFKTVAFWEVVSNLYDVNYVIKVDDDSYVRLDRLSIALSQWANMGAGALTDPSTCPSCMHRMPILRCL